jgi:hypothetical protein
MSDNTEIAVAEGQEDPVLHATHEGTVSINGIEIKSYVLNNGERVLSRIGLLKAIGRTGKAKGGRKYDEEFKMPVFLTANNLKPFISSELIENSTPVHFTDLHGNKSIGYRAQILADICYVFIDALEAGALLANQIHIAEQCKMLVRGFATTGILALVDEATGYQEVRERDALQKYLDQFLLKEHAKWAKRFPDEFFENIFKMKGWSWHDAVSAKKPQVVGRYVNDIVYDRLAPKILDELRERNPPNEKGNRKAKHHQFLTPDLGNPSLQAHLNGVMALQRVAGANWRRFFDMLDVAYPRYGHTLPIQFLDLPNEPKKDKPLTLPDLNKQLGGLLNVPPPKKKDKPKTPKKKPTKKKKPDEEKTDTDGGKPVE